MVSDLPLTAEMVECLEFARENGGKLVRFAGTYWSASNIGRGPGGLPVEHFSTSTVEALVRRGKLEYTQWRDVLGGSWPVAAVLKEDR